MVVNEKLHFEAYTKITKHLSTVYIHFILRRSKWHFIFRGYRWCLNFCCILRDVSDIHIFLSENVATASWLKQKLWISESSLSVIEKFKCHLDLLNIICNYTVDNFFVYASKCNFSLTTILKGRSKLYWFPEKNQNLLKFLQVVFTVFGSACCSRNIIYNKNAFH